MATNGLSIKLLINTKTNKLCFAEGGSDVVEFLTALLSLPLGTITNLLTKESMPGSVGTLLGSAEKLDANYNSKERHLSPAVSPNTLSCLQQLLGSHLSNGNGNGNRSNKRKLYTCYGPDDDDDEDTTRRSIYGNGELSPLTGNCGYLTVNYGSECAGCGKSMQKATTLTGAGTKGPVIVAAGATPRYTVKDDLSVTPASLSLITLLAECGVTDLSVLQEKTVKIGKEEALGILAAALQSKAVLTDVFMQERTS